MPTPTGSGAGDPGDAEPSGAAAGAATGAMDGSAPEPVSGLALFAAALLLLVVVGSLSQRYRPGPQGIALTEFLAILLPAVIFLGLELGPRSKEPGGRRQAVLRFLRLVPVTRRLPLGLLGAAVLGVGCFYVMSVWLEPLLERVLPVPPEERAHLLRLLRPPTGLRPLWQDLLCFAAVPALCEEVLFRGAILSTLGPPLGVCDERTAPGPGAAATAAKILAVVLCALLFGIFHLSWSKLLPTTLLGVGFGAAAIWGRALWPAIMMHFTNNALVVVLVRAGLDEAPPTARTLVANGLHPAPGALWLAAALAASAVGYWLLQRSQPPHPAAAAGPTR